VYRESLSGKKYGKAKALQWLLTHSLSAKLLAVKRITSNKGAKTSGVDKVRWTTSKQKLQAAYSLKRRGYKALPLKRILIPKKQTGKFKPLSIPTMHTRAMQALHLLGLEPISEVISNLNSYGFKPKRSAADNICIERFWRSAKCEKIYLNEYNRLIELKDDVKTYIEFYNHRRFHETLGYKNPMNVYNEGSNRGTPKEHLALKAA